MPAISPIGNRSWRGLLVAAVAFPLVFGLALGDRLPLHVAGRIGAFARERANVIDDITGSPVGKATLDLEGVLRGFAAL